MTASLESLMQRLDVTRKGAKRISKIMQAGVDILLAEGFTALTKRKIAARLGISHGNVSYYFPTRESLWRAVIEYEYKEFYRKHYQQHVSSTGSDQARFDEFVNLWVDEYKDRELRIFFSQILAFAEVNEVVADLRDELYEMFYQETLSRVRPLIPDVDEQTLELRVLTVIATLEGLHAVSAFRPERFSDDLSFREHIVRQVNRIVRGKQ